MTSNACQNVFYGAETSLTRYSAVSTISAPHNHGSYCCCNTHQHHHNQHRRQQSYHNDIHDDLQIINNNNNPAAGGDGGGGGRVEQPSAAAITLPDNASFSLSTTSNGSVVLSSRRLCECELKAVRKKRKKKKDEGMKLKRLLLLIVIFTLYVSIGAAVFNALEAGAEQERKDELQDYVEVFLELNKSFSTLLSPPVASNPEATSPEPSAVTATPTNPNDPASAPAADEEDGDREQPSSHSSLLLCESVQVVRVEGGSRNRLSVP